MVAPFDAYRSETIIRKQRVSSAKDREDFGRPKAVSNKAALNQESIRVWSRQLAVYCLAVRTAFT